MGRIYNDQPECFDDLLNTVLGKSCIPLFIRKIVVCPKCRNDFDDTRQFCPKCWKDYHQLVPIYHYCKVKNCRCRSRGHDNSINDMCTHIRDPIFEYCYYIPPIAIICDLLHNGYWDKFMGLTEESLVYLSKYCLYTKGYSTFTSLNMQNICEKYGMNEAVSLIKLIHNNSFYDNSSAQIMVEASRRYGQSRSSLLNNKEYIELFASLSSSNVINEAFLSEWFFDVFMSYIYSSQFPRFECNEEQVRCKNRLLKTLGEDLHHIGRYLIKKQNYSFHLRPYIKYLKSFIDSQNDLYFQSDFSLQQLDGFYDSIWTSQMNSDDLVNSLKDTMGDKHVNDKLLYLSSKKRIIGLMRERYSRGRFQRYPVIWVNRAKTVFLYMVMRSCLRMAIQSASTGSLSEVKMHLKVYVTILNYMRQRSNADCEQLHLEPFSTTNDIITHIKTLKQELTKLKGLDTQIRLLSKLASLLDGTGLSTNPALSIQELLNPSFTSKYRGNTEDAFIQSDTVKHFVNDMKSRTNELSLTSFSHELATMTIACDDVEVFHYSREANSVFVLSGFFVGPPHNLHYSNKINWFLALVPATKARALEASSDSETPEQKDITGLSRVSLKRLHGKKDEEARNSASTKIVTDQAEVCTEPLSNICLNDVPHIERSYRSQKQQTPANWRGRAITNLILEDIRLLGDRGIPIPYDSVLHFVRPAVLGFRFDNVAGDLLANSSGKQNSLSNCRDCDCCCQYWDSDTNSIIYAKDGYWKDGKGQFSVSMSVLSSLERDDPLRMISLVSLFKVYHEDSIWKIFDKDSCYEAYREDIMRDIKALFEICSWEQPIFWTSPTNEYFPPHVNEEDYKNTNAEGSVGFIDYTSCINGRNSLKGKDCMHMIDNLGEEFRGYFSVSKNAHTDVYDSLNSELRKDFIIHNTISISRPVISRHTLFTAHYVYEYNKLAIPTGVSFIIESILSINKTNNRSCSTCNLTSQQKMHFTLIYSQFLFLSSFSDYFCFSYVRLFNIVGRILAFRGSIESFDKLYKEMVLLLYIIENEKVFDISTINNHLFLHLDFSYFFMGPPKAIDCYEPEWTYSSLKETKATPNPFATLFSRCKIQTLTTIMEKNTDKRVATLTGDICDSIVREFNSILHTHLSIRVLSAYNSSKRYLESSTASIVTLWDIETISTLQSFLEGNMFTEANRKPDLVIRDNCLFPSNEDLLLEFASKVGDICSSQTGIIPDASSIQLYSQCKYKNITYQANCTIAADINKKNLNIIQKNYAFVMDIYGTPHLVCLLAFFSIEIKEEDYALAYCYEIPIRFINDNPSPYIAIIDYETCVNYTRNFVSVDRLHPAFFVTSPFSNDIFAVNDKVVPYQFV